MVFSSIVFLCAFLPITFILYTIIPSLKFKNGLLIVASLIFYAYGEPIYILLMLFSSLVNFIFAKIIGCNKVRIKKVFLILDVIINLGMLGIFKYSSMVVISLNNILNLNFTVPNILLPIGISFYTFQILSYVIDVYYNRVKVQNNYFKLLLYISFFPQLIAGPIVKYHDINEQIDNRKQIPEEVAKGIRRFIVGLSKKVLISNVMALAADNIYSYNLTDINIVLSWIGAISYMLQIYFDFSGYSDMAIGLGKMFGFNIKENFNYPYYADSIKDFWRRWHISLSSWFRDYLYIPLGGNRKGKVRTCINKIIVFFFTGLWHGANWTFVVWGLYHGLFLLLEEYLNFIKKMPKVIRHIYVIIVVAVGFVMFRANTLYQGIYFIKQMFTGYSFSPLSISLAYEQLNPLFIIVLIIAIIGSLPVKKYIKNKVDLNKYKQIETVYYILSIVLLLICIINLSGSTYNPFIYFRF
ncbi:MBOAT family protein [Anaerofustis stercorihominis DSM 17244]|uniref:MBOAT family protein n=2 Tax=Anaerofustis stercorihominis TaxID=214853 RepID=B1C9A9_9FIRM|nr:MBOAT family O-acyltransferase [Anaerofustis stercorihominis]EDS72273.1 MBOAT family protein [Anaerofustis stercorihominis DSM 17244]